jgi:hypothetical protein
MIPQRERRAAALEAIAHALLELAAVEREPEETCPSETVIDRRNCEEVLGLTPHAFVAAAGRDFSAFRVSKRLTASKADVLAWLKTRRVEPKPPRSKNARELPDPDAFLKAVNARFRVRIGRDMTDQELHQADLKIVVAREYDKLTGASRKIEPDEVAAAVQDKIGKEPASHADWRSLGLDPAVLEQDAEKLRQQLFESHPEMTWRERVEAVYEMWGATTEPLYESRRKARAAKRATKKLERAKAGEWA